MDGRWLTVVAVAITVFGAVVLLRAGARWARAGWVLLAVGGGLAVVTRAGFTLWGVVAVNAVLAGVLARLSVAADAPEAATVAGQPPPVAGRRRPRVRIVAALLGVVLVGAWGLGVARQWDVNHTVDTSDQSEYLLYAHVLGEPEEYVVQDRAIMPLYPYALSALDEPDRSMHDLFPYGKALTVAIAAVGLGALFWLVRRRLDPVAAAAITALAGFTVFMFKAPYVGADLPLYLGFVLSMVALVTLLARPSVVLAAGCGLALGFTHLVKPGVSPMLLAFLLVVAAVVVLPARLTGRDRRAKLRLGGSALVVLAVALTVVAPYLANSERVYGSALYNVNSTYYLWYDSWPQAQAGTILAGDQVGRPDLPAEEVPTFARYRSEHSVGDMADRVARGARILVTDAIGSFGFAEFGASLLVACLVAAASRQQEALAVLRRRRVEIGFSALVALIQLLAWSWWLPFSKGNRFVLTAFLPFTVASVWWLRSVWAGRVVVIGRTVVPVADAYLLAFLGQIVVAVPHLVLLAGQIYGGL